LAFGIEIKIDHMLTLFVTVAPNHRCLFDDKETPTQRRFSLLGICSLGVNDPTLALSSFRQCLQLTLAREINCTYPALVGLAELARRQAKPALAACLFGMAERFARQLNPIHSRWKEAFCRPLVTTAHAQLRDAAYVAAWAEGQAMPLDQAMQVALTFADPASSLTSFTSRAPDHPGLYAHRASDGASYDRSD
jgi:hypothetical protein